MSPAQIQAAIMASNEATVRLLEMKAEIKATAAVGNMPFPGHRTVATIDAQRAAGRRRQRQREREAIEYGFDPASLKRVEGGR